MGCVRVRLNPDASHYFVTRVGTLARMHWQPLWSALGGLLVGVWGRLAMPGNRPLLWPPTLLIGVGGALGGGALAAAVLGREHETINLVVAVVIAALFVFGFVAYERSRELPRG